MSYYRIECGACGYAWDVEASAETERCPGCGTEHAGPWDEPTVVSDDLAQAAGYKITPPRVVMAPVGSRGGRA